MRILFAAMFVVSLSGCAHVPGRKADHFYETVSLPRIALSEGERIESVGVTITCARFSAINHIPNDWSVEVVSPMSEVSTFKASAGHGSTALWDSRDLDRFITIMDCGPSCFSIKAEVRIFLMENERTVFIPQSELILKRVHGQPTR